MGSMRVVLLVAMVSRCLAAAGLNLTSDLPGISNSLNPLLSASIQIIPVVSDTLNTGGLTEATSLDSTTHSSEGEIEIGTVPLNTLLGDHSVEELFSPSSHEGFNNLPHAVGVGECPAPKTKLVTEDGLNLKNVREVTVFIIRTVDVTVLPDSKMYGTQGAMPMEIEGATKERVRDCPAGSTCTSVVRVRRKVNRTSSSVGRILVATSLTVL
ncbi:hypothetical protein BKA61DRAFT_682754 [Leptodontidium sp. MPI-SDFR-AT-0119]|nr:hypothetical protein BKA61DRAFT_682754 [Leptodontidium sp. MPI-SDFR-AT-0119]